MTTIIIVFATSILLFCVYLLLKRVQQRREQRKVDRARAVAAVIQMVNAIEVSRDAETRGDSRELH